MRKYALVLLCSAGSIICCGQGSVYFSNHAGNEVNAPFYDYQGRPLTGPDYVVQLYAGVTADSLTPIGTAVVFHTEPSLAGYFWGGEVIIPFIQAFDPVWAQVRAWAVAGGATYEQALAADAYTGVSNVLFVSHTGNPDGGVPSEPALLVGLQFVGVPEPAPWLLGLLGFGALAFVPRHRW